MSPPSIARPAATEFAPFYAAYVSAVPEGNLIAVLERQRDEMLDLIGGMDEARGRYAYAPGKWTIAEMLGHVIDAERVFTYRALTFARGDAGPLPSFDENQWAVHSNAGQRPLRDLLEEYRAVRGATLALFRGLAEDAFARSGIASSNPVSVRALAYIVAGHERHHVTVLRQRYLSQ